MLSLALFQFSCIVPICSDSYLPSRRSFPHVLIRTLLHSLHTSLGVLFVYLCFSYFVKLAFLVFQDSLSPPPPPSLSLSFFFFVYQIGKVPLCSTFIEVLFIYRKLHIYNVYVLIRWIYVYTCDFYAIYIKQSNLQRQIT